MTGMQFVVDEAGNQTAVLLDLNVWGEIWEDIHDYLVVRSREGEPTISVEELKTELQIETT